jgi:glycosyltransferase involved in cell wall biosynthesis
MAHGRKTKIIVSAVNFLDGGPLTILKQVCDYLAKTERFDPLVLVHRKSLVAETGIRAMEFPAARNSYLYRLVLEYGLFQRIAARENPDIWLSLHDLTPTLRAPIRAVYCHNPMPFLVKNRADWKADWRFCLKSLGYGMFYRINLQQNDYVIVQQNWMKQAFIHRYQCQNVIVSRPERPKGWNAEMSAKKGNPENRRIRFFYPAFARVFKNFEIICEAVAILPSHVTEKIEVVLTIDGSENRYSRGIVERYGDIKGIRFVGILDRASVESYYWETDCLIFPSRIETWGLPLSEFAALDKPIIAADLPYAWEVLGNYRKRVFFGPNDARQLARLIDCFVMGELEFDSRLCDVRVDAESWEEVFGILEERLLTKSIICGKSLSNA